MVAPTGFQRFPELELEVSTTFPPVQKVVGPPGKIVGVAGIGFTVTMTTFEVALEHPAITTIAE